MRLPIKCFTQKFIQRCYHKQELSKKLLPTSLPVIIRKNNGGTEAEIWINLNRDMRDPTKNKMPDRLFSSYYDCGGEHHTNAMVLEKGFYLASEGGDFNGYSINQGIGLDKLIAIVYNILLNKHISTTANFLNFYDGILASCNELKNTGGITNEDCQIVQTAFKAVEIDQQSVLYQFSPICQEEVAKLPEAPTTNPTLATNITPTPTLLPQPQLQ